MTDAEYLCNDLLISFGRATILAMIIPIIAAIIYRKHLNKELKIFLGFCIAALFVNLLESSYIAAVNNYTSFFEKWLAFTDGTTNFFYILYQLKSFIFLGWFYSVLLVGHRYGRWIKILSIFLCLATIVSYIIEKGWRNYGVFGPTADAIFLFVIPLFYLWYLYRINLAVPILKNPYFWISLGLAVPNLIGLFLFFTGDAIYGSDFCLFVRFSIAKNVFLIISQILLFIGFSRARYAKYISLS